MIAAGARLSRAASLISLICAVHCALTPVALLALPFLAAHHDLSSGVFGAVFSPATEWIFLGVIVVVAGFGVLATYPAHGDRRPVMLTIAGFIVLLSVHLWLEHGSAVQIAGDLIGASSIAWAGWINRSLCRCHGCHETASGHTGK
ncbi:MAG: MerC domain-containing protein [Deltaproteobacteria bacterium]|nr:MerC domain-containing protein [Deltaproteobacteria bacterium]